MQAGAIVRVKLFLSFCVVNTVVARMVICMANEPGIILHIERNE